MVDTPMDAEFDNEVARRVREIKLGVAARAAYDAEIADTQFVEPKGFDTLEDQYNSPSQPIKYSIEGALYYGGSALINARRKSGKTVFTTNLTKAYVDNTLFLDEFAINPISDDGRVLFLNYELTPEQFMDWTKKIGVKRIDRVSVLHLRGQGFSLGSKTAQDWLVEKCKQSSAEVLILDPFSRAFRRFTSDPGGENSNHHVGLFTDTLDQIKYKADVRDLFLTNHMGWSEDNRTRGASALEDWPDAIWRLNHYENKKDSAGKADPTRYFSAFGRGVEIEESALEFDKETFELRMLGGSAADAKVVNLSHLRKVTDYVRDHPGAGSREIERMGGISKVDAGVAVRHLVSQGKIEVRRDGRKSGHFVKFDVSDKGVITLSG